MGKKTFLIVFGLLMGLFTAGLGYAMSCGDHGKQQKIAQAESVHEHSVAGVASEETVSKEAVVNVGNRVCPVSGEKIDEKLKATYEYEGKIYNFCCAACLNAFKADPQKYIKIIEEEIKKQE